MALMGLAAAATMRPGPLGATPVATHARSGTSARPAANAGAKPGSGARRTGAPGAAWSPRRFPDGAGRAIAERGCLVCHSAMLVTQQHKDAAGWEKTVHQMELWGAPVPAAGRDTLLAYLVSHFGPRGR
jgi:cytochrome c5